jgi:hypothetical protein
MRKGLWIVIPIVAACNASGSVEASEEGTTDGCFEFFGEDCSTTPGGGGGGTDGSVIGDEDPGSGPGAGLWFVDAEALGERVADGGGAFHFETELKVDVEDDQGQPATGLDLVIQTLLLGDHDLVEDPGNPGRYDTDMLGYARTYTLVIQPDSLVERFETTAVGPGAHQITLSGLVLDITEDQTVLWSPSGASHARIDYRGGGNQNIDDTGAYTIEAVSLDYGLGCIGEERIEVRRWDVLDVTNAVAGSTFEVSIKVRNDEVDTTDPRRSDLDGEVQLDRDFDGMTGDVFVLFWPEKLDPDEVPFWTWTQIDDADFVDQGDYDMADLAPGDWFGLAYLDADGSDVGIGPPMGPTDDDPFDERTFTIDAGVDETRDFDLRDPW